MLGRVKKWLRKKLLMSAVSDTYVDPIVRALRGPDIRLFELKNLLTKPVRKFSLYGKVTDDIWKYVNWESLFSALCEITEIFNNVQPPHHIIDGLKHYLDHVDAALTCLRLLDIVDEKTYITLKGITNAIWLYLDYLISGDDEDLEWFISKLESLNKYNIPDGE